ncbi:MAG: hypothetical protein ACJA2Q_002451 [Pseudohongiellaceae bacterium]
MRGLPYDIGDFDIVSEVVFNFSTKVIMFVVQHIEEMKMDGSVFVLQVKN